MPVETEPSARLWDALTRIKHIRIRLLDETGNTDPGSEQALGDLTQQPNGETKQDQQEERHHFRRILKLAWNEIRAISEVRGTIRPGRGGGNGDHAREVAGMRSLFSVARRTLSAM